MLYRHGHQLAMLMSNTSPPHALHILPLMHLGFVLSRTCSKSKCQIQRYAPSPELLTCHGSLSPSTHIDDLLAESPQNALISLTAAILL